MAQKFVPKTKREKYLFEKLWLTLLELDECLFQYVPACTAREENASEFIQGLRQTFPELHKRYSKRMFERMMHEIAPGKRYRTVTAKDGSFKFVEIKND